MRVQFLMAVTLFLFTLGATPVQQLIVEGDEAWSLRASTLRQEEQTVDSRFGKKAVAAYRAALELAPGDEEIQFKLLEALYFEGEFLTNRVQQRRVIYDQSVALSQKMVDSLQQRAAGTVPFDSLPREIQTAQLRAHPHAAKTYFWSAISWGLWGMSHGYLASARAGVAEIIREHAERVIEIDDQFSDGGGYRLLGRMHSVTPKIPFFTGWIQRDKGIKLLRQANAISIADPRNQFFLADALFSKNVKNKPEAVRLLKAVVERTPDPNYILEQSAIINEAQKLLEEIEK